MKITRVKRLKPKMWILLDPYCPARVKSTGEETSDELSLLKGKQEILTLFIQKMNQVILTLSVLTRKQVILTLSVLTGKQVNLT